KENPGGGGYSWALGTNFKKLRVQLATDGAGATNFSTDVVGIDQANIWYYVAFSWSELLNISHIIIDKSIKVSPYIPGTSIFDSNNEAVIGSVATGVSGASFHGLIDEVRVSRVSRSLGWINTTRTNQLNPQTFSTLNSLEILELEGNWAFDSLSYRKNITILASKINEDLNNFPFLLNITDSDLKEKTQTNGQDILITDSTGTYLEHEIEKFTKNYNSTHSELITWIKIPFLSNSSNTNLTMYYGNSSVTMFDEPKNVWDDYIGVWHLSEIVLNGSSSTDTHFDSSFNGNNGNQVGNGYTDGQIAQSQNFDGLNDLINITNPKNLDIFEPDDYFISVWIFRDTSTTEDVILAKRSGTQTTDIGYILYINNSDGLIYFEITSDLANLKKAWVYSNTNFDSLTNGWHQIVVQFSLTDGAKWKIFIDGVDDNTDNNTMGDNPKDVINGFNNLSLVFGAESDNENHFDGRLDEIRFGRGVKSPDWISIEYNNQLNPKSFYIADQEQFGDFTNPVVNNFSVEDSKTGQGTYWANITDSKGVVISASIKINGSIHSMTYNGSLWIYQDNPLFNNTYEFSIINTTDSQGNFLSEETTKKFYTFDKDIIDPIVVDWDYDPDLGYLGTFKANVSDSWGKITSVVLEVTQCNGCGSPPLFINMSNNGSEYINDTVFMTKGQVRFRITVTDSLGNSATSSEKTKNVSNKAPEISDIQFLPLNPTTNQSLNISWVYFDPDGDNEGNSLIHWYKNGILQAQLNDLTSISLGNLSRDDIWHVTYQPYDGFDFGIINSTLTNVTIMNSVSIALNLQPSNDLPSNVDLEANWTHFDYDDDKIQGWIIKWYNNSVYQPSYYNSTIIPYTATIKGDTWFYTVKIYDGYEYSDILTSNPITILNTPPRTENVKIRNGEIEVTDDTNLFINYTFVDNDGDSESSSPIIYWFTNGVYNASHTNQTIISSDNTTQGEIWRFIIRVFDGTSWSSNATSLPVSIGTVSNNPPTALNLEILNDNSNSCNLVNCFTNHTLFATYDFNDIDTGQIERGSEIRWYKNGVLQSLLNDSLEVSFSLTTKGDQWFFTVTPVDEFGLNGSINTSPTITIKNAKPQITTAQLTPTTAYAFSTLNTYFDYLDIDNDNIVNLTISWYINNSEKSQYSNLSQIEPDQLFKHDKWKFSVRAYDGANWSSWTFSNEITILNSEPLFSNIRLTGGTNTLDDVTLFYDFYDADNDTDSSTYRWWIIRPFVPPTQVSTGSILDNSWLIAGDSVYVEITPNDGEGPYFTSVVSSLDYGKGFIFVLNTAPQIDGSPIIVDENDTQNFFRSNDLYVIYNASDLDGTLDGNNDYDIEYNIQDQIVDGAEYRWYRLIGGTWYLQPSLTLNVVPKEQLTKGDSWKVGVRIPDKRDTFSQWFNSSVIIIENTPPIILDITWSNLSPTSFEDLILSYSFFDIDNDVESQSSIRWFVNGLEIMDENEPTLSYIYFNKGDSIFALIIPYDGSQFGLEYNTSSFTGLLFVKNSLPEVTSVDINKDMQRTFTNDSLIISWSYFDEDGDQEIISNVNITWYRFNTLTLTFDLQSHLNNQTIVESGNTSKNDQWQVVIQVFDGQNYSTSKASKFLYIQNSVIEINSVGINSNENEMFSNGTLTANFEVSDLDNDSYSNHSIFWYRNGTLITTNSLMLDSSFLEKGYEWFFIIALTDDDINWTNNVTSKTIFIKNSVPVITDILVIIPDNREFYVDDEEISISYNFSDTDNDNDSSQIFWYRNAEASEIFELQDHLSNQTVVNYNFTSYGDTWYFIIIPSDGDESSGQIQSRLIEIFSTPKISKNGTRPPDPSEAEGFYQIWVIANDDIEEIVSVIADISQVGQDPLISELIQDTGEYTLPLTKRLDDNDNWTVDIDIFRSSNRANFTDYINKIIWIDIKVNTTINFNGKDYYIQRTKRISLLIEDLSPPRVKNVYLTYDNEDDPSSVTFTVEIEEFGSNIDNISLYYYFEPQTNQNAQLSRINSNRYSFKQSTTIPQEYQRLLLTYENTTGNIQYYIGTVDFNPNSTTKILYYIQTFDFSGNFNSDAYPDGHNEVTAPTW
ncbi:MAG: DUF2341 domain-containing protein, partial [Candidatus Kariarchaeaceae archaeon]